MDMEYTINECVRIMAGEENGEIIHHKPMAVLLSAFLGQGTADCKERVERIYRKGWPSYASSFPMKCMRRTDANELLHWVEDRLQSTGWGQDFFLAVYVDTLDKQFDIFVDALWKVLEAKTRCAKLRILVFAFVSKKNDPSYVEHIVKLFKWAVLNDEKVFVFDEGEANSSLDAAGMKENMEIAAKTVLIANTTPRMATQKGLLQALGNMFCIGYRKTRKDRRQIAVASLAGILSYYRDKILQSDTGTRSEAMKDCTEIVDEVFEETILPLFPKEKRFFRYLPRTREMESFVNPQGVVKRSFVGSTRESENRAIQSVDSFWREIKRIYYEEPLKCWLNGNGQSELQRVFRDRVHSDTFPLLPMADVKTRPAAFIIPEPSENTRIEERLSARMHWELKKQYFPQLFELLVQEMTKAYQEVCAYAAWVDEIIQNLKENVSDTSILRAYVKLAKNACIKNKPDIGKVRLTKDESGLLSMATCIFQLVVATQKPFILPYWQEVVWRLEQMGYHSIEEILRMALSDQQDRDSCRMSLIESPDLMVRAFLLQVEGLEDLEGERTIAFPISDSDSLEEISIYRVTLENMGILKGAK